MTSKPDDLPSDLVSALAALQAEREARLQAEAVAASARAELSANEALIVHLELRIEKLKRELYGQRSERTARLIEQLELELDELVITASEDELAARTARRKPRACAPSRASGRCASPGRTTSNASASSLRRQRPAPVAVERAWRSWARM